MSVEAAEGLILEGEVIATLPFNVSKCDAIVAMPISFNFLGEMISCSRVVLGLEMFDLLGIQSFSKNFSRESRILTETLKIAVDKHDAERIVIFQHVDFLKDGIGSTRFGSRMDEDYYHKKGLVDAFRMVSGLHPNMRIDLIYVRLVKDQSEIEFSKVFEDGSEEVCLRTPYRFRGVTACPTTVIQCLDYRFRPATRICIREAFKIKYFNVIGLPGSVKSFLAESRTAWKSMQVAYEKYGCREFVLVQHADCGAYGGLSAFVDAYEEECFQREELKRMRTKILDKYPDVGVMMIYVRVINGNKHMQFVLIG
ncbi:MAG: carbonic anhydrase [Parcubacteria group bacterium]